MTTLTLLFPLAPLFFVLIGLIKRDRFYFLLGYTVFAFLIIVSEFIFFKSDNNLTHLLVSSLFCVQLVISFPNNLKYDGTSLFRFRSYKNCLILSLINSVGIFIVLDNTEISIMGVAYHSIFAVLPFRFYFLTLSNRISLYEAPIK